MSFLGEPFKHDLFVSYSHGDFDGSGKSNLKTWSQAFVRELEGELRQHPKFRELKIFLDQHHRPDQGLDPMEALTEQLRDEIGAAGSAHRPHVAALSALEMVCRRAGLVG